MLIDLHHENDVCTITINRPDALNALSTQVLKELEKALDELAQDEKVRVVIFTGAGEKAFSAGADIAEMKDMTSLDAYALSRKAHQLFEKIQELPQPTIAAIHGVALGGGCELAMACDMRVASDKARFGQPEVGLGVIPGWGGTQRLPRLVGLPRAMEFILSGRIFSAIEAADAGLVNKVVPADQLRDEVMQLAKAISSKGPNAVRIAKQAVNGGLGVDLDSGSRLEASLFALCFGPEQQEGMSAFKEKRPAKFL